jgi:hypothetical protein
MEFPGLVEAADIPTTLPMYEYTQRFSTFVGFRYISPDEYPAAVFNEFIAYLRENKDMYPYWLL